MRYRSRMPIDAGLLEILACPVDHAAVHEEGERLVCTSCGRRYPVRDGIPVMLIDEATNGTPGNQGPIAG